jgi:hypothetical protein
MKYNPQLRSFVRLDAKGFRTSQIVFRKRMPKIGRWEELTAAEGCCTTTSSTTTTTTTL